jgi:hypothetical protein
MNLAEAVRKRHLVQWHDNGFIRTIEPHLLAQLRGQRLVVIALQIAGGPSNETQGCWKVIDVNGGLNVDLRQRFDQKKDVPPHLLDLVQWIYASAEPLRSLPS